MSPDVMTRMRRILNERGITDDGQRPDDIPTDEPGDPQWHHQQRVDLAMGRWQSATPPRYQRSHADHPDVVAWADQVVAEARADEPEGAPSLLLMGPCGTGKTHQAYGAARRIAEAGLARWSMAATTAPDLYASLRPGASDDPEALMRRLMSTPLLLLDDLGTAKTSEWTEEVTYRIVNHRYNRMLPSIFTTNLAPSDLRTHLGERLTSRLVEMTTQAAITGDDRRRTT